MFRCLYYQLEENLALWSSIFNANSEHITLPVSSVIWNNENCNWKSSQESVEILLWNSGKCNVSKIPRIHWFYGNTIGRQIGNGEKKITTVNILS